MDKGIYNIIYVNKAYISYIYIYIFVNIYCTYLYLSLNTQDAPKKSQSTLIYLNIHILTCILINFLFSNSTYVCIITLYLNNFIYPKVHGKHSAQELN